jgi:hypothetical protein
MVIRLVGRNIEDVKKFRNDLLILGYVSTIKSPHILVKKAWFNKRRYAVGVMYGGLTSAGKGKKSVIKRIDFYKKTKRGMGYKKIHPSTFPRPLKRRILLQIQRLL